MKLVNYKKTTNSLIEILGTKKTNGSSKKSHSKKTSEVQAWDKMS